MMGDMRGDEVTAAELSNTVSYMCIIRNYLHIVIILSVEHN